MSDRDSAAKGVFALSMAAVILAIVVALFFIFGFQNHAHGQERKSESTVKTTVPRSHSGTLLPKGCVSYPCGYQNGRVSSGIAEVVECPIGVEPPAFMDFQACRLHLWPDKPKEY